MALRLQPASFAMELEVATASRDVDRELLHLKRVEAELRKVIVGQDYLLDRMLVALLARGHALIEGVPGLAKTLAVKALAQTLALDFRRIQFTPDLLPSDVTGINYFNQKAQEFQFRPGPVFRQLLLGDEINRATPRTQSSLLEAMGEKQVTIDGETMALPKPFLVIATQNPIELEGTFPLPEAQLDRFLLQIALGYPTLAEEEEILLRYEQAEPLADLQPVTDAATIVALQATVRRVHINADVRRYILAIVRHTREHASVQLGVSPRGTLALYRASQALAALRGRDYVIPSDVKQLCLAVLTHRIHISAQTRLRGRTTAQIIQEIVENTPAPVAS